MPLTSKATVQNASILNGDKDDFSPMFYENGILYCSNSRKAKKDAENVPDDYNLKYAAFDSLGKLQNRQILLNVPIRKPMKVRLVSLATWIRCF
ncbi:MAG: hypothetical protein HC817_09630 [Saprospiraceae bacterium]|nr:hypothetical protein [Saprospiraceae bacterium]